MSVKSIPETSMAFSCVTKEASSGLCSYKGTAEVASVMHSTFFNQFFITMGVPSPLTKAERQSEGMNNTSF